MKKPSLIFMGTPQFALVSLQTLVVSGFPVLAVFTQPDKPSGRGQQPTSPSCAIYARGKKIPLFQPASVKSEESVATIKNLKPDFIVTAAYGQFLPLEILKAPKIDAVNLHGSLLPLYRGAAPVQWALLRGEKETGVTLMKMTAKMDAGPIYSQAKIPIEPQDTAETLLQKLAGLGAALLKADLPRVAVGALKAEEQNEAEATTAPLLKKSDGQIRWDKTAEEISNLIRGTTPWPGAQSLIDNKTLKIYHSELLPEKTGFAPGTIYLLSERGIHVACFDSSICLTEVQLEGKKRMPAAEFARGFRLKEGQKFS
ncbi:MAG: methionyl-tRNA formyltransferase [Deltaproteobacteria bacterium]|nr:methionyl-tRNA formyltransferase [Deltaproteobacteria bacterium]